MGKAIAEAAGLMNAGGGDVNVKAQVEPGIHNAQVGLLGLSPDVDAVKPAMRRIRGG